MNRHRTARRYASIGIGIALILIVSSLTLFAGSYPASLVLLGFGVLLLFLGLVFVQLSLWREGHAEITITTDRVAPAVVRPAPPELKHQRFRSIWESMEETRRLMEMKGKKAREREKEREKKQIGLPEEEDILFMEESSWASAWPFAVLSFVCIALSAFVSDAGVVSFLWLALGLSSFLVLIAVKGRTKYYLTNFRVLVRRKPIFKPRPRWSAMPYPDVQKYSSCQKLGSSKLTLVAKRETLIVEGLARPHLEAMAGILHGKLPSVKVQTG